MARPINRLTAVQVKTTRQPGRYADGAGLYLVVEGSGSKHWVVFYQWRGRRKEMGLGRAHEVSLAAARDLARQARDQARSGVDPIAARRALMRDSITIPKFGDACDEIIAGLEKGWRSAKTAKLWRRSLELHAASLWNQPIDEIGTEDVLAVLRPIWTTKPETASQLRIRIERILDAARVKGWRDAENPARWRGHLAHLLSKPRKLSRGHFPALPFNDLPTFMAKLRANQSVTARALEWTILTAAREGMTLGARWVEIDEDAKLWTIPADRMKTGIAHRVPLSKAALEVLHRVRRPEYEPDAIVFPGARAGCGLSNMAMDMLLRRLAPGYVPHGFRSTFRDWAGETTDHPREVAEAALAHTVGSETERAYRRGDALEKRRLLMDAWAAYATQALQRANPSSVTNSGPVTLDKVA